MVGRLPKSRSARHAGRGQMLIVFALALSVFVGALALGVDLNHLRAETENAQRAANAAALAGVVFVPAYMEHATSRAQEEATKNGFTDGKNGVTVNVGPVTGFNYRLRVTISEPVNLFFTHLFGRDQVRISRTATAEYLPPLQMGAPDYVLGFLHFPSYLTYDGSSSASRASQNFYLTQNGPYSQKEQGDPFDPYFESFNTSSQFRKYGPTTSSVPDGPNPCASIATTCAGTGVTTNANKEGGATFGGYKYLITVPQGLTVLVKLFDPFNEANYNYSAYCWDQGYQGSVNPVAGWWAKTYDDPSQFCNGSAGAKLAPKAFFDIQPTYAGHCALGTQLDASGNPVCRDEGTDNVLPTNFGKVINSGATWHNGSTNFTWPDWAVGEPDPGVAPPDNLPTTKLRFTLTGGVQSLLDPGLDTTQIALQTGDPKCPTNNCVSAQPFDAGDDPTPCSETSCPPSKVGYKFVNYAILHGGASGPLYYEITVKSIVNSLDGTFGEGNNTYGIGVCGVSGGSSGADPTYNTNDYNNPLGSYSSNEFVTSDPLNSSNSAGGYWNEAGCPNPNPPTCTNPRTAPPGACVTVHALNHMPLYNYIGKGAALIPLGYIPPDYAGRNIKVDLFDPGDVTSASSPDPAATFNTQSQAPKDSSDGTTPDNLINTMEVLSPAGDLKHVDGASNTAGTNTQPSAFRYYLSTSLDNSSSSYGSSSSFVPGQPEVQLPATRPLSVGNNTTWRQYNGVWVHEKITLPDAVTSPTYPQMVNGDGSSNSAFGGYWKVLYRLGSDSTDVTVWSLTVDGSTVHLVNP